MIIDTDTTINVQDISTDATNINATSIDSDTTLHVKDLQTGFSNIPYDGDYVYTPTTSAQTIDIGGKTATQNITIEPIPSNYGLVTWDGSKLTVS